MAKKLARAEPHRVIAPDNGAIYHGDCVAGLLAEHQAVDCSFQVGSRADLAAVHPHDQVANPDERLLGGGARVDPANLGAAGRILDP